ncbi:zinc-ribbon domain containing protein [Alienimonas sp. DA493]|uniref:zinc-ribbon domain containing protein n=1 Tax=Alienimonas sp. DA493 TaxID=3373605 RepID=UPI0037545E9A
MPDLSRYADYVEHPRYGRGPRFTPDSWKGVLGFGGVRRFDDRPMAIPGTYVRADVSRQKWSVVPRAGYFDQDCGCVDCGRRFIWFAEEQKHWFEELKFDLAAWCVRCVECRRRIHREKALADRYARVADAGPAAAPDDLLAGAAAGVRLIEQGVFGPKAHQRVRAALNRLPDDPELVAAADRLRRRLDAAAERPEPTA